MRVARVTASLGDTIVDLVHVAPGERYTIGTAPAARLAIAGVHDFPLVTGEANRFVVRRPVGLGVLALDGRASDELEVVLAIGDACDSTALGSASRVTFELGLVSIAIELVAHAPVAVPRPELERRTPAFVVASLIVHLLVWGTAITFAHAPRTKRPRPAKQSHPLVVHLAPVPASVIAPPPPPTAPSAPAAARAVRVAASSHAARRTADDVDDSHLPLDRDGRADVGAAIARFTQAVPDGYIGQMLDQVGPLYVPSAVDAPFGDTAKMDPKTRPGWGRVEIVTGRYRTISHGPGAGDDVVVPEDPPPASQGLALCESRRCEVSGGLAKEDVQRIAATRAPAFERCVNRGAVVVDLDIAADGRVTKVHGEGKGARCAAEVFATLAFPAAENATHAAFTIGYP